MSEITDSEWHNHDEHCAADRTKPMGCPMCSCTMYVCAKEAEGRANLGFATSGELIAELRLRVELDFRREC